MAKHFSGSWDFNLSKMDKVSARTASSLCTEAKPWDRLW